MQLLMRWLLIAIPATLLVLSPAHAQKRVALTFDDANNKAMPDVADADVTLT